MIRSIVAAAILLTSSTSMSWEMPAIPTLEEQYQNAKIDEITTIFMNEPYFAGKEINIQIYGRQIKVDRTGEPNKTPPGTPPPSGGGALASLTDVLNGLEAGAKGKVEINVERRWSEGGVLIYEKWGIVVGGQYNVQKKEETVPEKEDKKTGE